MAEYVIKKGGNRVHIRGRTTRFTLCGLEAKRDSDFRYPSKEDRVLKTCLKCERSIISIVN